MLNCFTYESSAKVVSIVPIISAELSNWLSSQDLRVVNLVIINKFKASQGEFLLIFDNNGELEKVLLGMDSKDNFLSLGALPKKLPEGNYRLEADGFSPRQLEFMIIAWGMGSYEFTKYKRSKTYGAILVCNDRCDLKKINNILEAIYLTRDLINTPADDLYPEKLAEISLALAKEHEAKIRIVKDEELMNDFPAVYAVGKGSYRRPVLIDLEYGKMNYPRIILIGKGVCFDSGGLQLKPSSGMALMKKDMAGAAHALALGKLIMAQELPVNLRIIVPAVENLPSGHSLKPGDIIRTRSKLTVEVRNTDAEGRLILADTLTLASEWKPKLILDFATLTGAARVALGMDISAVFSNDDQLAKDIIAATISAGEAAWQLPLYQPYLEFLKTDIADLSNIAINDGVGGGAIIAALVLQQFVSPSISWAHFDINGYNITGKPGKPKGGEANCLIGVFDYLEKRFRH